jgi:hypothetical protein
MTRGQRKRLAAFVAVAKFTPSSRPDLSPEAERRAATAAKSRKLLIQRDHSEAGRADAQEEREDLPVTSRASHFS